MGVNSSFLTAYIFIRSYAAVYFNKKVLFPASVAKIGQICRRECGNLSADTEFSFLIFRSEIRAQYNILLRNTRRCDGIGQTCLGTRNPVVGDTVPGLFHPGRRAPKETPVHFERGLLIVA